MPTACSTSDGAARPGLVRRLADDPTEKNLGRLRALVHDRDPGVRAAALQSLAALGAADAGRLAAQAVADPDDSVRAEAVSLVAEEPDLDLVGPLTQRLLGDPAVTVRQRSAEALARLGGAEAAAALIHALSDPQDRVRRAAVEGLGALGVAAAREPLMQVLAEDPQWEARAAAARALGAVPEVGPALEQALADPNEYVRAAAKCALGARAQATERVR